MANPLLIDVDANEWTKVATAVNVGQLSIIGQQSPQVLTTYRITGDPAPNSAGEGIRMSRKSVPIKSSFLIDVYVYPQEKKATIRVDV